MAFNYVQRGRQTHRASLRIQTEQSRIRGPRHLVRTEMCAFNVVAI